MSLASIKKIMKREYFLLSSAFERIDRYSFVTYRSFVPTFVSSIFLDIFVQVLMAILLGGLKIETWIAGVAASFAMAFPTGFFAIIGGTVGEGSGAIIGLIKSVVYIWIHLEGRVIFSMEVVLLFFVSSLLLSQFTAWLCAGYKWSPGWYVRLYILMEYIKHYGSEIVKAEEINALHFDGRYIEDLMRESLSKISSSYLQE